MKYQSIEQRNKQKKKQKTPRTFDDLGGPAEPVAGKKDFLHFFIAFQLTENNVVQSWFTKVIPSSLWRNGGPMGNWDGNCTIFGKYRIAPALSCRLRQKRM